MTFDSNEVSFKDLTDLDFDSRPCNFRVENNIIYLMLLFLTFLYMIHQSKALNDDHLGLTGRIIRNNTKFCLISIQEKVVLLTNGYQLTKSQFLKPFTNN